MSNMLDDLIRSSVYLHERFELSLNTYTLRNLIIEEVQEVLEALTDAQMGRDTDHAAEEFADLMVVCSMALLSVGCSTNDIYAGMRKVINKNDAKTHRTHAVDPRTGKITRLTKL